MCEPKRDGPTDAELGQIVSRVMREERQRKAGGNGQRKPGWFARLTHRPVLATR